MKALLIVLLSLLAACATGAPGSSSGTRSEITREEIVRANQMTALELVRSERPLWLRARGATSFTNEPEIGVYLDGTKIGGPSALAEIPAINIEKIRFYDSRQAQFRFGVGHVHGAIEVVTRRG